MVCFKTAQQNMLRHDNYGLGAKGTDAQVREVWLLGPMSKPSLLLKRALPKIKCCPEAQLGPHIATW